MKYIDPTKKEREDRQWYSKKIFLTEKDLGNPGSHCQELKIKPWEIAKAHHHKIQTEIFYFTTDHGYRVINWEKFQPKVGDILVIEPGDSHRIVNESDQDFCFIVFKIGYSQDDLYWDE